MNRDQYENTEGLLVATDCIIFGFDGKEIKVLLIKRESDPEKGKWSLVGGFVNRNESVDAAASRILKNLTGLTEVYMEQLYCFGDVNRDTGGRVISIAYYALINIEDYNQLSAAHETQWFALSKIPSLIFDHKQMVDLARERLQQKVTNQPVVFEMLPDRFTLPQLQSLYETIFETPLDKRNFTRKILETGFLKKLNQKEKESSRKGAFYYVFDKKKYAKLQHDGVKLI